MKNSSDGIYITAQHALHSQLQIYRFTCPVDICNSGSSFQAVVFNLYNYSTSKTIISKALNGNLWNKKKQCPATAIMRYIIKFYSGYRLDCLQLSRKKHYFKNLLFVQILVLYCTLI